MPGCTSERLCLLGEIDIALSTLLLYYEDFVFIVYVVERYWSFGTKFTSDSIFKNSSCSSKEFALHLMPVNKYAQWILTCKKIMIKVGDFKHFMRTNRHYYLL